MISWQTNKQEFVSHDQKNQAIELTKISEKVGLGRRSIEAAMGVLLRILKDVQKQADIMRENMKRYKKEIEMELTKNER